MTKIYNKTCIPLQAHVFHKSFKNAKLQNVLHCSSTSVIDEFLTDNTKLQKKYETLTFEQASLMKRYERLQWLMCGNFLIMSLGGFALPFAMSSPLLGVRLGSFLFWLIDIVSFCFHQNKLDKIRYQMYVNSKSYSELEQLEKEREEMAKMARGTDRPGSESNIDIVEEEYVAIDGIKVKIQK